MNYTAVIPHYYGVRKLELLNAIYALTHSECPPNEILVWNNGTPDELPTLDHRVHVIQSPRNIGCKARFLAALMARNDLILFQDNDVRVQQFTMANLLPAYEIYPGRKVLAFEGRCLMMGTNGNSYTGSVRVDGYNTVALNPIDISLGRLELCDKDVVRQAIAHMPFNDAMRMDDIWFSYALAKLSVPRFVVPYGDGDGYTNLEEHGVGSWHTPEHFKQRDDLTTLLFPV